MGYDLHVTRRTSWHDPASGPPISPEEWVAYVSTDAAITRDPENGPDHFLCVAGPDGPFPIWWSDGELTTKNPNEAAVAKLVEVAGRLDARVVGDEGEQYPAARGAARARRAPWWQRVFGGG